MTDSERVRGLERDSEGATDVRAGSARRKSWGGFTLVEVMVALVVFELGFLGVFTMTLQAQRTFLAAAALESTSWAVEWVADSLSSAGWGGPGSMETDRGVIHWAGGMDGLITITFEGGPGSSTSLGLSLGRFDVP